MDKDALFAAVGNANAPIAKGPFLASGVALGDFILRELEARMPGFRDAVRERMLHTATAMENAADAEQRSLGAQLRVFAGAPALMGDAAEG